MKNKLINIILLGSIILSGCGTSNDQINISEWMFSDDLNPYECENTLGKAEKEDGNGYTRFFWNDYEICNKYSGTLSLLYFDKQDEWSLNSDRNSYSFQWTIQCSDNEYEHISHDLENSKYIQKTVLCEASGISNKVRKKYRDENGLNYKFITNFKDENYNPDYINMPDGEESFSISSAYKDGVLSLRWGCSRSPL